MKIFDRRIRISDSLKISDFSNNLGVLQHPKHPQQYAYEYRPKHCCCSCCFRARFIIVPERSFAQTTDFKVKNIR